MTRTIISILGICISYFLPSCASTKNIAGKYRSNFAVHGFFVTRINLNPDSTFGYKMSGDLMFDTSNGHYRLDDNFLILTHQPFEPDTSDFEKHGKEAVLLSFALSTNQHLKDPGKYLVGNNKLFVCDSNGIIVKKQFGHSKRRQYLFFW